MSSLSPYMSFLSEYLSSLSPPSSCFLVVFDSESVILVPVHVFFVPIHVILVRVSVVFVAALQIFGGLVVKVFEMVAFLTFIVSILPEIVPFFFIIVQVIKIFVFDHVEKVIYFFPVNFVQILILFIV